MCCEASIPKKEADIDTHSRMRSRFTRYNFYVIETPTIAMTMFLQAYAAERNQIMEQFYLKQIYFPHR